jgi:hypothetical protein
MNCGSDVYLCEYSRETEETWQKRFGNGWGWVMGNGIKSMLWNAFGNGIAQAFSRQM